MGRGDVHHAAMVAGNAVLALIGWAVGGVAAAVVVAVKTRRPPSRH